ncbi:MAG: carbon-nitrogen family hydrolase [Anaerolineae bacterium]|jgi:predicted amidohydrolase|nr:carbon-nitrogen family hydrolase [Anaerolineae bacterium]
MPKLNISLGQFRIALGDPTRNWTTVEKLAQDASKRGSHLLVLPELWSTGYALDRANALATPLNSGIFTQIAALATQSKLSIVGSVLEKRGQEVTNSATFFTPKGQMLGVYRKIHLFRLMSEDAHLRAGQSPLLLDMPWGKTAFAICYDLRFPELMRRYAVEGAKICIIPAEWPIERVEHWTTLLRARAIENQMYVVACNACGETGGTTFAGHSMVIDPWGKVVGMAGEDPSLLTVEIELERVDEVRQRIPVFEDRRPDLY